MFENWEIERRVLTKDNEISIARINDKFPGVNLWKWAAKVGGAGSRGSHVHAMLTFARSRVALAQYKGNALGAALKGSGREFRPRLRNGDALIIGWHGEEGADEAGRLLKAEGH